MKANKSIVCIGWCDADNVMNYGQILQALAMMKLLRECTSGDIKYISYFPRGFRGKIKYILEHVNIRNGHLRSYIRTKRSISKNIKNNGIEFYQIQSNIIPNKITDNADILVCGSDQLWHPQNYNNNFFLGFGSSTSKRIAFAVSLPKTHIEEQFKTQYANMKYYLNLFDFIAVREQSSVQFVSELSGKDVISVMDPTFLIDIKFWNTLIEKMQIKGDYIFVYIPNGMNEQMSDIILSIKNTLKIDKVFAMITRGENLVKDATILNFISVGEFLYLIKYAKCVITTSFHAVVFSSIFHTNFYTYDVKNVMRGEDIRLKDILETLDLEDRNICTEETIHYQDIDFLMVEKKIKEKSDISLKILKNNIR